MKIKFLVIIGLLCSIGAFGIELSANYQESAPKYFKESGVVQGICYDYILALNKELEADNIKINNKNPSSPFVPWARMLSNLENGTTDIIVGAAISAAREEKYTYIKEPLYEVQSTFAKKKDFDFDFDGESSLSGMKINYVNGSKTGKYVAGLNDVIGEPVNSLEIALKKLNAGRCDLVYYHSLGLGYNIKKLNFDNLDVTKSGVKTYYHYIALNKNTPAKTVKAIEAALLRLKEKGEDIKIMEKYLN
ncbi:MAG: hypothetical protein B6229_02130 [Spirochaetaceae bacterium 4572_7]|nr:MAG: hypothetical protein B6229_02130 [Spirochaetaceae bacterium 4572_7]